MTTVNHNPQNNQPQGEVPEIHTMEASPLVRPRFLLSWCAAELKTLRTWADMLACENTALSSSPRELAQLVTQKVEPVAAVMVQIAALLAKQNKHDAAYARALTKVGG